MFIPETLITEAVTAIISARDFCGNERDAVKQIADDNGISDKAMIVKLHRIANFRANAEWNNWKKLAGVPAKHCF